MRPIHTIIIHCSATKPGQACNASIIDKWHRSQGYRCIGYHYVILEDGTVEQGRPIAEVGAHCLNHNNGSIGICYCGGLDATGKATDTRTSKQRLALQQLVAKLIKQYPSIRRIAGHNEFASKACPCFNVKQDSSLQQLLTNH